MMKRVHVVFLVATVVAVAAVGAFGLRGDGAVRTEERKLGGFASIEMSGGGELRISRGAAYRVAITLDGNLLPEYRAEVVRGRLVLGFKPGVPGGVSGITRLVVEVTMPELEALSLSGAVGAHLIDAFSGRALRIGLSGASSVLGRIDCARLALDASGGSRAELSGKAVSLDASISGASELRAKDLAAATAHVRVSGASRAELRAEESVDAEASGASTIRYYGTARLSARSSGASVVECAGR